MIKSYKLKLEANQTKIDVIRSIATEYRKVAKLVMHIQLQQLFQYGRLDKNLRLDIPDTSLSARYLQTLQYQVVGVLDSYLANIANRFKDIVLNSSLDNDTKIQLLYINKYKKWFYPEVRVHGKYIDPEILHLARKIFKHIFNHRKKPNTNHIHLQLDSKVAIIQEKNPDKAKSFDYWIKLSTLDRRHPVLLPVRSNSYYESIKGTRKNFVQLIIKDSRIDVVFMKEVDPEQIEFKTDKIALDLGLTYLFATDKGDLFGRQFIRHLERMDTELVRLQSELQKQGIKPTQSSRYNKIVFTIREYIKNEINRILNRIFDLYRPKEIIIERLNFKNTRLSRKLNRLLNRFGKGIVTKKLQQLHDMFGVKITEINPAYTSQTCSSCGHVHPRNRKDRDSFICTFCGKKINADVNAARNILTRSFESGMTYFSKSKVLDELARLFIERHRNKRLSSCAVVVENLYYSGILENRTFP